MTIRLTGFADEAGSEVREQVRAHRELGWDTIEMRNVGKANFAELDEAAYAAVRDQLQAAGMGVSCFGSAIANWARPISGDFQQDLADLRRAAPRMRELGTGFIRVMSYPNDEAAPLSDAEWLERAAGRLRELAGIAEGEGVVLVHENCSGYGGQGPEQMLRLIEAVDSPAFKVAFDTGNQIAHYGYDNPELSREYYRAVRTHVVHVHIKDNYPGEAGKPVMCYPGEGRGQVREIVTDLVATGYQGFISIEPHMKGQVHLGDRTGAARGAFETYVEYGRRMAAILEEASSRQPTE
jgi:sugar phosphate isomerase/epimerase